jgi:ATP-binding cassette, subfamily B, bacterial
MGASIGNELKLYGRLFRHAGPYRLHLGALLLLSLLATPIALVTPLPLKIAVDSLTGAQAVPGFLRAIMPESATDSQAAVLTLAVGLLLIVALLDQCQRLACGVLGAYAGERLLVEFRACIFRRVQRLSFSYHDTRGTADSVFRINWDAAAIQWIAVHGFPPLVSAACLLAGMVVVVALIDWQLTLVALAVAPIILLLTTLARKRLRRGWQRTKDLESAAYGVVQEVLTGLRVVKAFGQEDREQERFVGRSDEAAHARVRMTFAEGAFGPNNTVASWRSLTAFKDVTDGLSNTLLIGEKHVQNTMFGQQAAGDNSIYNGDDIHTIVRVAGRQTPGPIDRPFAGSPTDSYRPDERFGSYHVGGCQFVLCDGSVRMISTTVDIDTLTRLAVRNDGLPVGDY